MYRHVELKTLIFACIFVTILNKYHLNGGCYYLRNPCEATKKTDLTISLFCIIFKYFVYYLMFENVQASNVGVSEIFISFLSVPVEESS